MIRHFSSRASNFRAYPFLKSELGLGELNNGVYRAGQWVRGNGGSIVSVSPANNEPIAEVTFGDKQDLNDCITAMEANKTKWMQTPMPVRGEIVRQIGESLRLRKDALGSLISLEMGKIKSEGDGEVQEFIDICDMAVGMSRSIGGKVIPSERPDHMMIEQWNPLGSIGVISAFNFPAAVLGWNTALALICGDSVLWKGHETTSLVSVATAKIVTDVLMKHGFDSTFTLCQGTGAGVGEHMLHDDRLKLISFTGSTKVGRHVGREVSGRFGRSILELGGNNAAIIMPDANIDMAIKACTFAAVGTCGQRCTTLRRMIVHESVYEFVVQSMVKAYQTIKIGDPLDPAVLCGPLHSKQQLKTYHDGLLEAKRQGGKVLTGGKIIDGPGNFVHPTIVEISPDAPITREELFVPILYVMKFKTFDEAVQINNNVPQGLSSSIFTKDIQSYMKWIGPLGSDCGIVNCNIGPSGAEIGGAFGGDKETGGGRESGSDSWKQYMRRSTCTASFSDKLTFAQGVRFDL